MNTLLCLPQKSPEEEYKGTHGKMFDHRHFEAQKAFSVVGILPELHGKPWNLEALGLVGSFETGMVRVTKGEITTDARQNRVTVYLDKNGKIDRIEQERLVFVP